MLKCSKCLKDKPESEFYKDSKRTRGYYYVCRPCFAASRYGKRHVSGPKVKDPIKERARGRVRDAVRHGKISKPDSCQMCGKQTQQKLLDAHHFEGYDKPLNVRWLCRPCHGADHAGYGALPPSQSL